MKQVSRINGYRWGAWFFGLAVIGCGVASLLVGDAADREASYFTPIDHLAHALLSGLMLNRLVAMALVAAIICFILATVAILAVRAGGKFLEPMKFCIACAMVGVLYFPAIYAVGFVAYRGVANMVWMIGIPVAISIMSWPSRRAVPFAFAVAVGGYAITAALSVIIGIPLD